MMFRLHVAPPPTCSVHVHHSNASLSDDAAATIAYQTVRHFP